MKYFRKTKDHAKFWKERDIDWNKAYGTGDGAWNHPHRYFISYLLRTFTWASIYEVGCGAGANLINIVKHFPNIKGGNMGGCDISEKAIEAANKTFSGARFYVGSVEQIPLSDDSIDVLLSDMCLIYIDSSKIDRAIKEIRRSSREYVILCEFHSPSWWKRQWLRFKTGYNAYDYRTLLDKYGFYDIQMYKIPEKAWPGGYPQKDYGYIILARVPRKK